MLRVIAAALRAALAALVLFSMKLWLFFLAVLWLAVCGNPAGVVDRSKLGELAVGQTTAPALTAAWGPPLTASRLPDGRQMMVYRYTWLETGPVTFLPGLGHAGSSAEAPSGEITLTFDQQSVLQATSQRRLP